MKQGTRSEARVTVNAPPEKVYAVVSDVRRMGEWSPECRSCEWIDGATGPAVGARFKGRNRRGPFVWVTKVRVVAADEGREFAFVTGPLGRDVIRWTYAFEADGQGGTTLTESFELLQDLPLPIALVAPILLRVGDRRADLERNMEQTLERIKSTVEGSA